MGGGDVGEAPGSEVNVGGAGGGELVTINVRCSNAAKLAVQARLDSTVGVFKEAVAAACDVPAAQQRLIYKGRILKDDQTLGSYGVESDHTLHLVRGAASSASASPPSAPNVGASTTPDNSSQMNGRTPSSGGGGGVGNASFGDSIFPGLGAIGGSGASGLFGAGFPELDQVQQQLAQNPNMMREIMNMPVIQNLMNNPELMRNMIMNNPQMRDIIDRNPDLAHILNDPSTLRQTLEAARNPELMREMMRNTDRAMSNIESSPEGFNMLRRMYETVQEPFLNATTMAGESGADLGSNPFAALLGNPGTAGARERSTNPSTASSGTAPGSPAPNSNPLPNPWSNSAGGGQANSTRSPPVGDARAHGLPGMGGLGLPDMEQMLGGFRDPSFLNQLLANPAVTQMMQNLLSNPQYVNQILNNFSPNARNLLESNAQFREMLQNPEFLQQLMSPETLRQLGAFQQSLFSVARQQPGQGQNQTGTTGAGAQPNPGLDFLMNMLGGGLGSTGLNVPNANSNVPPEELYATQLSQLQEMGFFDTQENIQALSATAGNVHAAVERLLRNLGQ